MLEGLPLSHRVLEFGGNPRSALPSPAGQALLTSCPLGTWGHSHGLAPDPGGWALAAQVHRPCLAPPVGTAPRGWAAPLIYANLLAQAPPRPCPSVPRLALSPQHVHSTADVLWAVRVGAVAGRRGRAAQGTLGCPCPTLWRGRFCLCTFASFVMKCNKNPMFSSLSLPIFSYPLHGWPRAHTDTPVYTWGGILRLAGDRPAPRTLEQTPVEGSQAHHGRVTGTQWQADLGTSPNQDWMGPSEAQSHCPLAADTQLATPPAHKLYSPL